MISTPVTHVTPVDHVEQRQDVFVVYSPQRVPLARDARAGAALPGRLEHDAASLPLALEQHRARAGAGGRAQRGRAPGEEDAADQPDHIEFTTKHMHNMKLIIVRRIYRLVLFHFTLHCC